MNKSLPNPSMEMVGRPVLVKAPGKLFDGYEAVITDFSWSTDIYDQPANIVHLKFLQPIPLPDEFGSTMTLATIWVIYSPERIEVLEDIDEHEYHN